MNNTVPNIFKRNSNLLSSVPKTESNEAKKKRSSFYDDFRENANQIKKQTGFSTSSPALKLPDLTPQKTQAVLQNPVSTGSVIKKNIESVLSKKYGELDTRNLFDGIDDKDIEDNIETAENTIKTNVDRGLLSQNALRNLPNLLDGLALSYAAADKGKSRAATRAREAAYTENIESLVNKVKENSLSYELPKVENAFLKTKEKPRPTNLLGNPNEKPNIEKMILTNQKLSENKKENFDNLLLDTDVSWKNKALDDSKKTDEATNEKPAKTENPYGVRFVAWLMNQNTENQQENEFDYSSKKSSTLDKYELSDAAKDWILPTDGFWDIKGNFMGNDYISAITDVARWKNPTAEIAKDAARAVWKTGSEFYLRPKGLDISADMLEHSLQEKPKDVVFYEDSDVVKQIKNNSGFITHLDEVVYKKENNIPLTEEDKQHNFEASDNQDLYYSIHGCHFDIDNISYNEDGTRDISVHISDNYDYTKIWTSMDGKEFSPSRISLGTIANDMGTITSKIDAINPYKVDIYFTIRR